MKPLQDSPEARRTLAAAYKTIAHSYADAPDQALFMAMEEIQLSDQDGISPRERFVILCSALYAVVTTAAGAHDVHPYSVGGYDLSEAISAFVCKGVWTAEKEAGLPDDTITPPQWATGHLD
jgi:hypothetical protein